MRARRVALVLLLVVVGGLSGASITQAQKKPPTTCTLAPVLRDVTINQGVGAYSPLVNGKETLARFYLSMPSCAASGALIQVKEGSTLTVSGGGSPGTIDNPTPVPTSSAYPAIASYSAAPMIDSTGDPKFVIPASTVSKTSAFTASFSATIQYQSRPNSRTDFTSGQITFSNQPGTSTPIRANFDRPSNALGVLFVPMGDATKSYSSQWTSAGQQALQDGMTAAVARQYPLPSGTGALGGTGGLRYSVTPTLLDLKALNLLDGTGKFCGTGANYDLIKGQLAQFRLSHNSANPNAQANRVVGVVDPDIGLGPPAPCFEGMAVVNSQEAWALAIPGRTGNLIGLELAHTLGLTPPNRESPFDGAHSQNTAAENPSVNRRYNTVQRSFITIDRSLLKPSATSPSPDNVNTLLEVPDHAFLLCVFGGTPNSECTTYGPGTVSATEPVAATLSFVMSGTTTGEAGIASGETGEAVGTSVVESYFASTVPQTAPSPSSTYRLVQRGSGGGVLSDLGVPVSFLHSGHEKPGTPSPGDAGTRDSGLFSFALPFDSNADRIELWKGAPGATGSLLLYARDRTIPPVVSSFRVGEAPIGYRPGQRSARILATFTVNTTVDSGPGSLRQAILDANATPGADTITFTDTMTIAPTSALPTITEAVTIDGTQGSSTTPGVTLDGIGAGGVLGLRISAGGTTIRRLAIVRFDSGVFFDSGSGSALEASYVGIGADGVTDLGNTNDGVFVGSGASSTTIGPGNVISGNTREGIHIQGTGATIVRGNLIGTNAAGTAAVSNGLRGIVLNGASGNTIGGTAPGAGNVISGNSNIGLFVFGSSNTVQGNRIGTNSAGTAAVPNGPGGIQLIGGSGSGSGTTDNVIGGTASGAGNLISGNTGPGILMNNSELSVANNTIQGNKIGTDVTGNSSIPNSGVNGHGISITNVGGISGNVIGAAGAAGKNVIAYNSADGISIQSGDPGNVRNTIRENEIHTNGGLGIDLGANGVTANDAGDGDTGANDLQNFPVLTSAGGGSVQGTLSSAPNRQYVVELFSNAACDASGNGEAARFLESFAVTTDASGNTSFTRSPPTLAVGEYVTATATDASVAVGSTSELSACILVSGGGGDAPQPGPMFTVNTNSDATATTAGCTTTECTLREAISASNAASGANTIEFDIDGVTQIALTSALPSITGTTLIDGWSQPSESTIVINGDGAGVEVDGLVLAAGSGGSEIRGLEIRDFFSGAAVRILSADNAIHDNTIHDVSNGVVVTGTAASNNTIGVEQVEGNAVGTGNRIWSFFGAGVRIGDAGSDNQVAGNTIGFDGSEPTGGDAGVIVDGTTGAVIGADVGPGDLFGLDLNLGNVVVGAGGNGIELVDGATGTVVAANFVGTDRAGTDTSLGNGGAGIRVELSSGNQLGPGNTVARNGSILTGIRISSGSGNRIVANSIHDNLGKGIGINEGANGDLSEPALTSALSSGSSTTVSGTVTAPNGTYYVELFRNAQCDNDGVGFGEGETYLDFATVIVTDGSEPFSKGVNGLAEGDVVTATLTHSTNNNTSEFSNCETVEEAVLPEGQEPVFVSATDDNPEDDTLDLYLDCGSSKPKHVIAVGLKPDSVGTTSASWSTNYDSTLAPANCELQAIVMDGFSRSSFTTLGTEPTTSGPNALVAAISSPREDATFLQYGLIPLRGSIRNAEAELTGATLEWAVDGPGTFARSGTGTIVDLQPPNGGWPAGAYTATFSTPGGGSAATDIVNFTVLTDADNDGIPANVESQSCFAAGADGDPLNADDDSDGDGIANANDPQPCVPATSYTAIVDFTPDPLPTGSTGTTVTVEVRVPGRNIAQVLASSVRITRIADEDVSADPRFANVAWTVTKQGVGIAKFDRQKLIQYLADRDIHNRFVTVTVAGRSGAPPWSFEGYDTVFVQG